MSTMRSHSYLTSAYQNAEELSAAPIVYGFSILPRKTTSRRALTAFAYRGLHDDRCADHGGARAQKARGRAQSHRPRFGADRRRREHSAATPLAGKWPFHGFPRVVVLFGTTFAELDGPGRSIRGPRAVPRGCPDEQPAPSRLRGRLDALRPHGRILRTPIARTCHRRCSGSDDRGSRRSRLCRRARRGYLLLEVMSESESVLGERRIHGRGGFDLIGVGVAVAGVAL